MPDDASAVITPAPVAEVSAPLISSMIQVTAFDPEARADPYPRLKTLQTQAPVFQDEMAKSTVLTRYADVREMVNDRTLWRSPAMAEEGSAARRLAELGDSIPNRNGRQRVNSILTLDDPDHKRIREPLTKALYARVAAKRADIEAVVGEVIAKVIGRDRFDLIAEVAIPIPITVIARVLGVDPDRYDDFRTWSEAAILFLNPMIDAEQRERMIKGSDALADYFEQVMAARRLAPQDDLITDMVRLQADGAPLSDAEIRTNLIALLVAGNLTTTDVIGNGTWLLLTHPEELAKLRADPSLAANVVEEVLRYEPPVDLTGRVASRPLEVRGCPIHTHRNMSLSLRAANRDPEVFTDPNRFDISRREAPHMAFGGGAHICIGAPLARIEAKAAFTQLFAGFPTLRLAEQELAWRALPLFRGLERLELETG